MTVVGLKKYHHCRILSACKWIGFEQRKKTLLLGLVENSVPYTIRLQQFLLAGSLFQVISFSKTAIGTGSSDGGHDYQMVNICAPGDLTQF